MNTALAQRQRSEAEGVSALERQGKGRIFQESFRTAMNDLGRRNEGIVAII